MIASRAFGVSQWGDNGYENHRDIAWPLIAAAAEHGWSGTASESATVEARFQTVFHGHPLPELTQLREIFRLNGDDTESASTASRPDRLKIPKE